MDLVSSKRFSFVNLSAMIFIAIGSVGCVGVSVAQTAEPAQTLDRVSVFSSTRALDMGFNDAARRNPDFEVFDATPLTSFTTCHVTSIAGLFCLDGKLIRNWPSPKPAVAPQIAEPPATLFSCEDRSLGLDTRKVDTCTSMTVDLAGNIWLAGKKGSSHSLIKVVRKVLDETNAYVCPTDAPFLPLTGVAGQTSNYTQYCAYAYASGRPLLLDISAIDGDLGATFTYGPGILGLEDRKTLQFFKDVPGAAPIEIASGKSGWGLTGSEQLQGATILQRNQDGITDNFALVTTSNGRIIAKEVRPAPPASTPFDTAYSIPAERAAVPSSPVCTAAALYAVRASSKSGRVFITDRAVCQVAALKPDYLYTPSVSVLPPAPAFTLLNEQTGSPLADLTLSTRDATTSTSYPPSGLSISPGIDIDLSDCTTTACTLIPDSGDTNEYQGATLSAVQLDADSPSGMVLFQIKNIPDCRYINPTVCNQQDVVVTDGSGRQYLNVSPLMPPEILKLFDGLGPAPAGLPPMLISPEHSASASKNFTFDAFFGITDPAIRFRKTFVAQFDISQLDGSGVSRCGDEGTDPANPNLDWALITTVSERYATVGGPTGTLTGNGREHVDMLTNTGCLNPTSGSGTRWSLYSYGLQPTPDPDPILRERTYATMLSTIYGHLETTRERLACHSDIANGKTYGQALIDETATPPLTSTVCSQLAADWANGKDKLDKCILAATSPKTSAGDQNCQAFRQQLAQYQGHVDTAVPNGPDPANRVGELQARVKVVLHVFDQHFLLSIPPDGFDPLP